MNILLPVLFIIIGFPLIELYFLIEVGSVIGALPTILLTIFTAVTGIFLIRMQGMQTLAKLQLQLRQHESPAISLLEGALLLIAAFMLLLPGFVSDSLGFLLLIPPLRHYIATSSLVSVRFTPHDSASCSSHYIEGEFEEIEENPKPLEKKSFYDLKK